MIRILVCGDRHWGFESGDAQLLWEELNGWLPFEPEIIEGCAHGADQMAEDWARTNDRPLHHFPADWTRHGRAAGPIRNRNMMAAGKPDIVLAFHHDLDHSKGTKDIIAVAVRESVPYVHFG